MGSISLFFLSCHSEDVDILQIQDDVFALLLSAVTESMQLRNHPCKKSRMLISQLSYGVHLYRRTETAPTISDSFSSVNVLYKKRNACLLRPRYLSTDTTEVSDQ